MSKEVLTIEALDEQELAAELPGVGFSIAEKIAGRLTQLGSKIVGLNGRTVDIMVHTELIELTRESLKRRGLRITNECEKSEEVEAA